MLRRAALKAQEFAGGHKRAKARAAVPVGDSAAAQLARARSRARAAQERAHRRMKGNTKVRVYGAQINTGVGVAVLIFLGGCVFLAGVIVLSALKGQGERRSISVDTRDRSDGVQVQIATGDEDSITIDAETARIFSKALSDMKIEWTGDFSKMSGQINTIAERFRAAAHEAARQSVEHHDIEDHAPIALPPGTKVVSAGGDRVVVHSEGRETVIDRNATTVNPALLFAGSWVVLDDAPVNGPERDRADALLDTLARVGVPLLTSRTVESQGDLELIASARATAGATTADDGPSSQRLLRWLNERGDGPIGILRISRGDGEGQILSVVVSNAPPIAEAMREAIHAAAEGDLAPFPVPAKAPRAPTPPKRVR